MGNKGFYGGFEYVFFFFHRLCRIFFVTLQIEFASLKKAFCDFLTKPYKLILNNNYHVYKRDLHTAQSPAEEARG